MDQEKILSRCRAHPLFNESNAYNRTVICCTAMVELGVAIPGWEAIRQIIGKGSATDIAKGVVAARALLAERLDSRKSLPEGYPSDFLEQVEAIWVIAQRHADQAFAADRDSAHRAVLAAEQDAAAAAQRLAEAAARLEGLQGEVRAMQDAAIRLQAQLDHERGHSASLLARQDALVAELREQRATQERSMQAYSAQHAQALKTLDDQRKWALQRIDDVATLAKKDATRLQAELDQTQKQAGKVSGDLNTAREQLAAQRARGDMLDAECARLRRAVADRERESTKVAKRVATGATKNKRATK
jgi:hypothetical protein